VTAVVKPFVLDDIKEGLKDVGVHGMTVTETRGFRRPRGHAASSHGPGSRVGFVPEVRVEVLVEDALADHVVKVLMEAARLGTMAHGAVWTRIACDVYRVRTGEAGEAAI
jgi:nitrogen regulatory protein P-II 1